MIFFEGGGGFLEIEEVGIGRGVGGFFRCVFMEIGIGYDGLEILFGDHSGFGGIVGLSFGRYDTTKLRISVYNALSWFWATNLYNERIYLYTTTSKI
jgi:hypothetical protein